MLGKITDIAATRTAEYARRKKPNEERTFRKDEREFAEGNGWSLIRENKGSLRFEKPRGIDERLENEFWRLLYELGYPALNVGRRFKITVVVKEEGAVEKQIDIFAYDNQTVIVAECKACEKRTKRQLQKDIGEFASLQKSIAISLKKHFGGTNDRKIIWMFVTKNVDWSQPDIIRAADNNIKVVTERELPYFKEIAKRIGQSARFQFQAEFLAKQKVASLEKTTFAMRAKLGKHRVYAFFTSPDKILPISFVNHRDLRDPSAAPSYQRLVQRDRLKQIADFITEGGLFPNSIILNFRVKVRFDPLSAEDDGVTPGKLTLPNTYKSAWIIDGQHRLYGYAELEGKQNGAMLPFIAFENISTVDETKLFSEINSKQKRVEKRLLDELTGEIKLESADKREQMRAIASRVFDLMRDDDDCPLGGKITGVELKISDQSVLTIPYLVDAVVRANLIGSVVKKEGIPIFLQGAIEWNSAHAAIDQLREFLAEYLTLFKAANHQRWDMGPSGKIANNPSVSGIIRFAEDIIRFMSQKEGHDPRHLHPKELVESLEPYLFPVLDFIKDGPAE